MEEIKNKVINLIKRQRISYITSIDEQGYPNTKAMLRPRKIDELKYFYFSTNTSSLKVKNFRKNPKACIYFCNTLLFKGVMFKGTVEVLEDLESKNMIWRKTDTQYYSLGVNDPDYCVLKFTAESARYYFWMKSYDLNIE